MKPYRDNSDPHVQLERHEKRITVLERRSQTPATGSSGGDFIFPPTQESKLFNGAANRDGDLFYIKSDATVPAGAFLNNFANDMLGSAHSGSGHNGDVSYFRFALGPQGSTWKFQIGYMTDAAFGIMQFGLASNAETYNPADGRGTTGRLAPSVGLTYVEPANWFIDGYSASSIATYDALQVLQISGDPGTAQTSMTHHTGYFGGSSGYESDGGPGIYTLRLRINGKNASSSGYNSGIWSLVAVRIAGDNSED